MVRGSGNIKSSDGWNVYGMLTDFFIAMVFGWRGWKKSLKSTSKKQSKKNTVIHCETEEEGWNVFWEWLMNWEGYMVELVVGYIDNTRWK